MLNALIINLARWFALAGGGMLMLLVAMTIISIIGRSLSDFGLAPIVGDFELIEQGMAIVIFWSLPWCQVQYGHVAVDIVARYFPSWLDRTLAILTQSIIALMAVLIAWQSVNGLLDKYNWHETSIILETPIWWSYGLAVIGAWLWVFAACATLAEAIFDPDMGKGSSDNLGDMT